MSITDLLRREWAAFRRPGRLTALAVAVLAVIGLGLLSASGSRSSCDGPCPATPVAADDQLTWHAGRDRPQPRVHQMAVDARQGTA
ncbi:hypothetical protein ACWCSD_36190, partial [Nonomuraea sp. NPDC001684]